jgi:hypothetical protein
VNEHVPLQTGSSRRIGLIWPTWRLKKTYSRHVMRQKWTPLDLALMGGWLQWYAAARGPVSKTPKQAFFGMHYLTKSFSTRAIGCSWAYRRGRPNAQSASRFGLLRRGGGFRLSELASTATRVGLSNFSRFDHRVRAFGRFDRCTYGFTRKVRRSTGPTHL